MDSKLAQRYINSVQIHLDSVAREKGYDGILSACSYATSKIFKFMSEGQACVEWRDAVWGECYLILNNIASGKREVLSEEELISSLPKINWPVI